MDKHEPLLYLQVERPLYQQEDLNQAYHYEVPKAHSIKEVTSSLKPTNCKSCVTSVVPVIQWLKEYNWKKDIISDIISGLTVAVMHIPQGMAYALLGNLPPVVGIYMAFFPVLTYFFFGTSRHVSMGTFAVVCLMTGKAVAAYSAPQNDLAWQNHTENTSQYVNLTMANTHTPMQVATAVTLMVGIYQIIMYVFRLGIISTLLSESLVNSFTTGAAVYVLLSQIKDLLGLKLQKQKGYFKLIFTVIDIFKEIPNTNIAAAIVSVISIIILTFNNEFLKPFMSKKCNIPIPIELIAVVAGTLISRYCDLGGIYDIKTVGHIPVGLPVPEIPSLDLLPTVAIDSIAITMVSYTITISMALIFSQKLNYEINSNQELFAMGISNIVGSFFSCMPFSASLSRSLIQQTVGGRTQIASIVSCLILLIILLWIGPFFEPLPRCVLASIIVVALKGMFVQAAQIVKFWKLNKCDSLIWIVTFFVVVLVNIDIGLLAGILTSLAIILIQSIKPYTCLLGYIPNSDLYLDLDRYNAAVELSGIKIIHYCGSLNFANNGNFKSELYKLVGVTPQQVLKRRLKLERKGLYTDEQEFEESEKLRCIIVDMSAMCYIDPSSVNTIHAISVEYAQIGVEFYLAGCFSHIFETIKKCDLYAHGKLTFKIFPTIHDAVTYTKNQLR